MYNVCFPIYPNNIAILPFNWVEINIVINIPEIAAK